MTDALALHIERTYQAPAEAVFDAWTSEEVLPALVAGRSRLGDDGGRGRTCAWAAPSRVAMRDPSKEADYGGGGKYTEIDPPNRLAFTWIWDGEARQTLIELDFEEVDGVTTVSFTHSGLWTRRSCSTTRTAGAGSSTTSSAAWRRLAESPRRRGRQARPIGGAERRGGCSRRRSGAFLRSAPPAHEARALAFGVPPEAAHRSSEWCLPTGCAPGMARRGPGGGASPARLRVVAARRENAARAPTGVRASQHPRGARCRSAPCPVAPRIEPLSTPSAATMPIAMTARTTAYSAIV